MNKNLKLIAVLSLFSTYSIFTMNFFRNYYFSNKDQQKTVEYNKKHVEAQTSIEATLKKKQALLEESKKNLDNISNELKNLRVDVKKLSEENKKSLENFENEYKKFLIEPNKLNNFFYMSQLGLLGLIGFVGKKAYDTTDSAAQSCSNSPQGRYFRRFFSGSRSLIRVCLPTYLGYELYQLQKDYMNSKKRNKN